MLPFRILVLIAAVLAVALSALSQGGDASAQTGGAEYVGSTEDGRIFRFEVSDDATEISSIRIDAGPDYITACGMGVIGFEGPWPIISGHFEIHVDIGPQIIEPVTQATEATMIGDFQSDGRVEGTYRAMHPVEPTCDTGELLWSGHLIPLPGPTFSGEISQGGSIEFTLSSDREFVTELLMGPLEFDATGCPPSMAVFAVVGEFANVPALVTEGQFEILATVVNVPPPTYEFSISGVLVSETEAEGTARVRILEQPECDTGVLTWTATAPAPAPSPSPPAELPAGGAAPPQGDGPWPRFLVLGAGALIVVALALTRRLLRPR